MIDERLINEAKRLLEKYKQIDSSESLLFQDWLIYFIKRKDINYYNLCNHTLLMATVIIGETYFARLLLENGALINAQRGDGATALLFVVKEKNIGMIKLLLSFGADPNIKDVSGSSILNYTRNRNYKEIFNLLSSNYICEKNNLEEEENLKEEVKRLIKM